MGVCDRKGYRISISSGILTINDEGKQKAIGILQDKNLYRMAFQTIVKSEANVAASSDVRL